MPTLRCFLVFPLIAVSLSGVLHGEGPDDTSRLESALDEMDRWLGDESNGNKWRTFLQSAGVRQQMEEGGKADPAIVARALQQYRSETAGLGKRKFVAVRDELATWLGALQNQYVDDLPKLAWAARGDHEPVDDARMSQVRAELQSAARSLESRLGGGSAFAQAWKDYLRWPQLQPHLAGDVKITGQTLRELDSVQRRLRANKPGLEHPVFIHLADALERYRELAFWHALGQRRDTRPHYDNYLKELEKQLTRNIEKPTVESSRQVGKVLGLMHQLGHSPNVEGQIRAKFARPNVWAEVSTRSLQRLAQRPVSETTPVRDFILGARVRGTAFSQGHLSLQTLPAHDHIALQLHLAGTIRSRTNSYKKPVRVTSLGNTNFSATKRIAISDDRFLLMPSTASARTSTRVRSVKKTGGNFGRRLIERIARKKVAEQKGQAEYIGARHAETRIETKFDRQVVEALHEARQNYDSKLHPPLERIGMFPEHLSMASSTSGIQIETRLANYKQVSTDRLPPGIRADNDVSLRVHETAVNNFFPHLLAGAKIRQDSESEPPRIEGDVPDWMKKATQNPLMSGRVASTEDVNQPAGPQLEPASDSNEQPSQFKPWSFLLNNEHPVSVGFDDQKMTLRIRIAELTTLEDGEESVRRNWDFLVTYRVIQNDKFVVLRREGKIEALPTGFDPVWFGDPRWSDKLTSKQVAVRKNLEENINKRADEGGAFPEEIPLPPITLPTNSGARQPLRLQELHCDEGWLVLGYRLP